MEGKRATAYFPVGRRQRGAFATVPLASVAYVLCVCCGLCTGFLCAWYPPGSDDSAGGVSVPATATCLRATRHADYTVVQLALGSPLVDNSLLLRFEVRDEAEHSTRVFSQSAVESFTASCNLTGACVDAALAFGGDRDASFKLGVSFLYVHPAVEAASGSVASGISGVSGELFLRRGYVYWLTSTHFCYDTQAASQPEASSATVAVAPDGVLYTTELNGNRSAIAGAPALSGDYGCGAHSEVRLFPPEASVETSFLSISDTSLYNSIEIVERRRVVAEIGTACASGLSDRQNDLTVYQLDCAPYGRCRESPSVPFRRASKTTIYLDLSSAGGEFLSLRSDDTLGSLPGLADETASFWASLGKLVLVMLCALVVFVRSRRVGSSSSFLFLNCVAALSGRERKAPAELKHFLSDVVVGAMAVAARLAVVVGRSHQFSLDNQARVVATEVAATAVSGVHFTLRYAMLERDADEPAVLKLGGSSAVMDATAAVMLAFSETPTLSSAVDKFDPTARLLTSLVISIVAIGRCAWSAACCGVLVAEFWAEAGRRDYALVLLYSSLAWCFQAAALVVVVSDLYVAPSAYMMSRSVEGDATSVRLALLFAVLAAGLPRVTQTTRHIASQKDHVD